MVSRRAHVGATRPFGQEARGHHRSKLQFTNKHGRAARERVRRKKAGESVERVQRFGEHVVRQVARVWVGSPQTIQWCLAALLARGHLLMEDVPGVGKTLLAKSLSE